jgi:hypothetical protein
MAATPRVESDAAGRRRLTDEILSLGRKIDKQPMGPKRLEMLREQARMSDQLESLRSIKH